MALRLTAGATSSFVQRGERLWVMGDNREGQLGGPELRVLTDPTPLTLESSVAGVAAGRDCTFFLSAGTVWVTGRDECGRTGLGRVGEVQARPVKVETMSGVTQVAAGDYHTLFLAEGVWVCGCNERGQLGREPESPNDCDSVPRLLSLPVVVVQVTARECHSLLRTAEGLVYAFGANDRGQLGLGHRRDQPQPTRVELVAQTVLAVGQGSYALTESGLWSWGANEFGQLGLGHALDQDKPQRVIGPTVTHVAAGRHHLLVLAPGGQVWGCGSDHQNQLGLNVDVMLSLRPLRWLHRRAVMTVGAGHYHSLVGLEDGTVLSFGLNGHGQLGMGTVGPSKGIFLYSI